MKNLRKVINELRMLAGDYLLAIALKLYPTGRERDSLCVCLSSHFRLMIAQSAPKNDSMTLVRCFVIDDPGDESVGIFPSHYELTGDFWFEDAEEKILFERKLKEAFEYVTENPHVAAESLSITSSLRPGEKITFKKKGDYEEYKNS